LSKYLETFCKGSQAHWCWRSFTKHKDSKNIYFYGTLFVFFSSFNLFATLKNRSLKNGQNWKMPLKMGF